MDYVIVGKGVLSHLLTDAIELPHTTILTEEELRKSSITFAPNEKVYAPFEASLHTIVGRMQDTKKKYAIEVLKDKFAFRELIKDVYPDFFYKKTVLKDLSSFQVTDAKTYVVKPVKGFFGYGIKFFDASSNMTTLADELSGDLQKSTQYFPSHVISNKKLLIEEYIPGEEYAVDMFYNKNGKPQIMNIYHHPIPKFKDYFNVLYYSDKKVFDLLFEKLITFFEDLQKKLTVSSFPIHAEFKMHNNQLIPVELNPLRFGGMGLADLTDYAYGFNPFESFFTDFSPNWEKIWEEKKEKHFAWVLGYDGAGMNMHKYRPNHEKFKKDLGTILHYDSIDYQHNPAFASAYIKLDKSHLDKILAMDFTKYFIQLEK